MDAYSLEVTLTDEEWDRYLSHKRRWCEVQPLLESHGYKIPKEYNPDRIVDWQERPAGLVDEPYVRRQFSFTFCYLNRVVVPSFTRRNSFFRWSSCNAEILPGRPV
jgi:hypothetical protein